MNLLLLLAYGLVSSVSLPSPTSRLGARMMRQGFGSASSDSPGLGESVRGYAPRQ